ncbi:MAG: hypothetical protein A3B10_02050 [Candidatus Doudnabacteria bacterium RIFCSPLOWO2_01_FULL_44_21]|uniref:Uncharacterized protein n=1 Tax=Candidatus Doudnabacteria bacterium RIFCSPLOWO2_01_FULL_44_21 TaxID=1817841 RepID=A0A1F5Q5C3_9BACT|nr:MAG: hypothetical protein A3B95_00160 [Candidatus Doudnabacteria bacterium RIFCSPHIGHO2_02_FULL_43_13b]OGE97358.1 MAG: hypothetical protein A3B10_02050 [Candidatus Doudnabacteria bacterium RIFCSPLOWO2_01_FULL_44_21]
MDDDKLTEQLESYRKLASEDKQIDVASLMVQALQKQPTNFISDKEKRWAYLISLIFPPFGFLFALKFYISDKDDRNLATIVCVVLTFVSIITTWTLLKTL